MTNCVGIMILGCNVFEGFESVKDTPPSRPPDLTSSSGLLLGSWAALLPVYLHSRQSTRCKHRQGGNNVLLCTNSQCVSSASISPSVVCDSSPSPLNWKVFRTVYFPFCLTWFLLCVSVWFDVVCHLDTSGRCIDNV